MSKTSATPKSSSWGVANENKIMNLPGKKTMSSSSSSQFPLPPKPPKTSYSHFPASCAMSSKTTVLVAQSGDVLMAHCQSSNLQSNCKERDSIIRERLKEPIQTTPTRDVPFQHDQKQKSTPRSISSPQSSCCLDDSLNLMTFMDEDQWFAKCTDRGDKFIASPERVRIDQQRRQQPISYREKGFESNDQQLHNMTNVRTNENVSKNRDQYRKLQLHQEKLGLKSKYNAASPTMNPVGGGLLGGSGEAMFLNISEQPFPPKIDLDRTTISAISEAKIDDDEDFDAIPNYSAQNFECIGNHARRPNLNKRSQSAVSGILSNRNPNDITPLPSFEYDEEDVIINNKYSGGVVTENITNISIPSSGLSNDDLHATAGGFLNDKDIFPKLENDDELFMSPESSDLNVSLFSEVEESFLRQHSSFFTDHNSDTSFKIKIKSLEKEDVSGQEIQHVNCKMTLSSQVSVPMSNDIAPPRENECSEHYFIYGVPTFVRALSSIPIAQVSAHPMGSHVLMIGRDTGILFSYGSNCFGQLGLGTKTNMEYSPQIVTPLLENGGKCIKCAAGVTHSLVVVKTDGQRSQRQHANNDTVHNSVSPLYSSDPVSCVNGTHSNGSGTICHHQVYGFGSNDDRKLGLINPIHNDVGDVVVPRRVGLHATVLEICNDETLNEIGNVDWDGYQNFCGASYTGFRTGIIEICASVDHSMALLKNANGIAEVFFWGKSVHYGFQELSTVVALPSLVQQLSYYPDQQTNILQDFTDKHKSSWYDRLRASKQQSKIPRTVTKKLSFGDDPDDYPLHLELGPECALVLTFKGRVYSLGTSLDGLLGLGDGIVTALDEPKLIQFNRSIPLHAGPNNNTPSSSVSERDKVAIASLSVGARHAVAVTHEGRVFVWGCVDNGRLGILSINNERNGSKTINEHHTRKKINGHAGKSNSNPENYNENTNSPSVVWSPCLLPTESLAVEHCTLQHFSSGNGDGHNVLSPSDSGRDESRLVEVACAGYDNTVLVMKSGAVTSFGKRSGRLGQGEVVDGDVHIPRPMFGGLRLWQSTEKVATSTS